MTLNWRMTLTVAITCVLTSTILYPLFDFSQWFYAGIGAVMAVAACGALGRLRTLPVLVCLAISVLGLLLYLNLVFEARHCMLGVIPTLTSVARLWDLAGAGMTASRRYAPPVVPEIPGLVLLATAGIGITAVLADLIAVRLRSAALAGLPLLVLFTVPVTMKAPSGTGTTVVFCLSAAGYLAMLSADGRERIRVWGKLVSLWRTGSLEAAAGRGPGTGHRILDPEPGPDTRGLAAAGRRVGLASVVLALAVPLIVPGLHPSKLFSSGPGIGGGSSSGVGASSPPDALQQTVNDLRESHPTTVLTYTTSAPKSLQENDPQYLREYVFDTLTDSGWSYSGYKTGETPVTVMPRPQGLAEPLSAPQVTTTVDVVSGVVTSGSAPTFLPVPYPPIQVLTPPGLWLTDPDGMVFSQGYSPTFRSYQVRSLAVNPNAQQLQAAPQPPKDVTAAYTQLPQSYRVQALKALAETYTSGLTTEYAKVDALALWLGGSGFSYSPAAPYFDNAAGLLQFLTKGRSGVCVQFAYAMTVLTRLLGIPARMVQGFTQGTSTSADSYVVNTSDAHAWTEVYFSGYGWIRFEPTPGGQGTARRPDYMIGGSGQGSLQPGQVPPGTGPLPNSATASPGTGFSAKKPTAGSGETGTGPSGRSAGTPWAAILLAVVAAIALACGVIAIAAPPTRRVLSRNPADPARQRRAVTATMVVLLAAAAAVVALALYRLLSHTSGLDLRAGWATVGIAFGAACAVMLIVPAAGRIGLRRWRWMAATDDASRAHTAWREFCDDLEDFGVGYRPSEPPRTVANRVTSGLPGPARDAIRRLALAEERASYAAHPSESANLRRDGAAARRGIAAAAPRGSRWRARIFPASMLAALADATARIPDHAAGVISRRWTERRSAS